MTTTPGPTEQDFRFAAGETWSIVVTCRDAQGDVIDLTGATSVKWRLATVDADLVAVACVLEASLGSGITLSGTPTDGKLTIAIPDAMQDDTPAGAYRHELRITTASGAVSTQMVGLVTVLDSLFDLPNP